MTWDLAKAKRGCVRRDLRLEHSAGRHSRVTGMRENSRLMPPNILPAEIDTDHPERIRGLVVDSSNPLMIATDIRAYRDAFKKLDVLVVIDVARVSRTI